MIYDLNIDLNYRCYQSLSYELGGVPFRCRHTGIDVWGAKGSGLDSLTLIFDLDGTIVDTAPDLVAATNHALATVDLAPVPGEIIAPFVSFGARAMIDHALELSGQKPDTDIREKMLSDFLTYYGDNIAVHSKPYDGVLEILEKYKRIGARLGVCTNKREGFARKLLKELAMERHFDAITGSDTLPVHKPDPGHLIATVILAKGNLDRAIMVGDSKTDIDTARAAGMPFLGVSFGYTDVPMLQLGPDGIIDHYAEFDAALNAIGEARKATGADY